MKTIQFDGGRILQTVQTMAAWNKVQGLKEPQLKTTINHACFFKQWINFKAENEVVGAHTQIQLSLYVLGTWLAKR